MDNLLFYALLLALAYYFFYYLPQQRKNFSSPPNNKPSFQDRETQTDPETITFPIDPGPEKLGVVDLPGPIFHHEPASKKVLFNKDEEKALTNTLDQLIKGMKELSKDLDKK